MKSIKTLKRIQFTIGKIFLCLICLSFTSCGNNLFEDFAKKDTDEALYIDAKLHMNKQEWDFALAKFAAMSTAFAERREVRLQNAKALAGACGVQLLALIENLAENLDSGRLLNILMGAMAGATAADADYCIDAEAKILSISTDVAERTAEENTTLAFIAFGKIGAILAAYADDADGDGVVDGDFDGCDSGAPGIPDTYVNHVGTGITIGSVSLTAALAGGGDVGSNELTELSAACTNMGSYGGNDFCDKYDVNDFTALETIGIRFTINDNQTIGVGGLSACNLGDPPPTGSYCICP